MDLYKSPGRKDTFSQSKASATSLIPPASSLWVFFLQDRHMVCPLKLARSFYCACAWYIHFALLKKYVHKRSQFLLLIIYGNGFFHKRYRRAPPPCKSVEFSVRSKQTVVWICPHLIAFLAVSHLQNNSDYAELLNLYSLAQKLLTTWNIHL